MNHSLTRGCILSKFYIKPQQVYSRNQQVLCCILSKFYIKPQQWDSRELSSCCCILSKFYIKPQPWTTPLPAISVVSYRNSTSNHNNVRRKREKTMLYLIEILHQTTTCGKCEDCLRRCILSKFYIKPQHEEREQLWLQSCILSKFYIKPQLCAIPEVSLPVVSYRNSTSNHNSDDVGEDCVKLYLIEILHQTTTSYGQHSLRPWLYLIEILHQTTTTGTTDDPDSVLYLIEILHQTTTLPNQHKCGSGLYLIEILHQTTTSGLILIDKVLLTGCLPL